MKKIFTSAFMMPFVMVTTMVVGAACSVAQTIQNRRVAKKQEAYFDEATKQLTNQESK